MMHLLMAASKTPLYRIKRILAGLPAGLPNIYNGKLYNNSQQLKIVNYCFKGLLLRCFRHPGYAFDFPVDLSQDVISLLLRSIWILRIIR